MARGWESKSVEAQQEAVLAPKSEKKPHTPEEMQRSRERENLRLARARVLQQIEASTNPRYQDMLRQSLAHLDRQLSQS